MNNLKIDIMSDRNYIIQIENLSTYYHCRSKIEAKRKALELSDQYNRRTYIFRPIQVIESKELRQISKAHKRKLEVVKQRIIRLEETSINDPNFPAIQKRIEAEKETYKNLKKDPNYPVKIFKAGEHGKRAIIQVDLITKKEKKHSSIRDAADAVGTSFQNIWKAVNQKRPHKGFFWKYA